MGKESIQSNLFYLYDGIMSVSGEDLRCNDYKIIIILC